MLQAGQEDQARRPEVVDERFLVLLARDEGRRARKLLGAVVRSGEEQEESH
jgi:hypothetical protein